MPRRVSRSGRPPYCTGADGRDRAKSGQMESSASITQPLVGTRLDLRTTTQRKQAHRSQPGRARSRKSCCQPERHRRSVVDPKDDCAAQRAAPVLRERPGQTLAHPRDQSRGCRGRIDGLVSARRVSRGLRRGCEARGLEQPEWTLAPSSSTRHPGRRRTSRSCSSGAPS